MGVGHQRQSQETRNQQLHLQHLRRRLHQTKETLRKVSTHRDRLIQGRRELMWKNQELRMQMEMIERNQLRSLERSLRSQLEETSRTMTRTMMEMAPHAAGS